MNNKAFGTYVDFAQTSENKVLVQRAEQYSTTGDRMHNFKEAQKFLRPTSVITPEISAWGIAVKHLVLFLDIIYADPANEYGTKICYTPELIREACGDLSNYIKLIEAQILEKRHPSYWENIISQPPF